MPREDPGNRLRQRQQLLRRDKRVEQFCLVWDRAQSPADIHFEPEFFFASLGVGAFRGDQAQVMHASESASMLRAATERRLKLPAKILAIGMPQQEFRQSTSVGRNVE